MKALVIPIPHKRRTCLHVSGAVTTVYIALLMLRIHNEIFTGIGRLFDMYWDYLGFITNSVLFFLDFPDSTVLIVDITIILCGYNFTYSSCSYTTPMAKHSYFGDCEEESV